MFLSFQPVQETIKISLIRGKNPSFWRCVQPPFSRKFSILYSFLEKEAEQTSEGLDYYQLNDFNSVLFWLKTWENIYELFSGKVLNLIFLFKCFSNNGLWNPLEDKDRIPGNHAMSQQNLLGFFLGIWEGHVLSVLWTLTTYAKEVSLKKWPPHFNTRHSQGHNYCICI